MRRSILRGHQLSSLSCQRSSNNTQHSLSCAAYLHHRKPHQHVDMQRAEQRRLFVHSSRHDASTSNTTESIQPQTHYDFFRTVVPQGPPPAGPFAVDTKALRRAMLKMQGEAHPDHQPAEMKSRAEALSARISEAYKTLSDPLLRSQYLLSLRGIDVAEDETAKVDDQGLLMEVLEAQETIEDADKEEELEGLWQVNEKRWEESVRRLEAAFEGDDIDSAKTEAVRLRYWTNIREGIRGWEPGKEVRLVH